MKIAVYSNAPHAPTGYGTQTRQLVRRLHRDGHDVMVMANYGLNGAPTVMEGVLVMPGSQRSSYSTDNINGLLRLHGADLALSLYDVWPLLESGDEPFKDFPTAFWTPIDHEPVVPKVIEWAANHDTIAMSKWGAQKLREVGVEPKAYIPHALDLSTWRPFPETREAVRASMGLSEGTHLTGMVAANIGTFPPRKAFHNQLIAWRIFAEKHENAHIYVHTMLDHPRGLQLGPLIHLWGIPKDRLHVVDPLTMNMGLLSQDDMARLYSAFDVTMNATMGEGFGLATLESQACGVPVIVTDFSASPELVGAGWKVQGSPAFDYGQGAYLMEPSIAELVEALEASYEAWRDPRERETLKQGALAKAQEYDADKVYEEMWKPLVESYGKPQRVGMTNAAKRRAKKAKAA